MIFPAFRQICRNFAHLPRFSYNRNHDSRNSISNDAPTTQNVSVRNINR